MNETETTISKSNVSKRNDLEEGRTPRDDDYVTYVRPKENTVLPQAKYKNFLVVFVEVWFAGTYFLSVVILRMYFVSAIFLINICLLFLQSGCHPWLGSIQLCNQL
jgi:hypothetical protein